MKKILAFIICIVLIGAMPITVFAEDSVPDVPSEVESDIFDEITPESIINWCYENWEEIAVAVTTLLALIYQIRKNTAHGKAIGILNNNSIAIAEKSEAVVKAAIEKFEKYEKAIEDRDALLKAATLANLELSDEVAELLVLANIPNSKKDELYARHLEARKAIVDAGTTEVKGNDGLEA